MSSNCRLGKTICYGGQTLDLVLKISDKCNFACDFCSSNEIAVDHKELDIEIVKNFIREHKDIHNIIVNGGDPLCIDPSYYWDLLACLEEEDSPAFLSFTSNLWDFYKNPDKWIDLFKNERVGVCTSFQYGNGRKLASGKVFTEDMFVEIFNSYLGLIGERLTFIAVINEENEDTVIKTVKLAKKLQTTCKINGALRSGRTLKPYPYWRMMEHYLNIIRKGYGDYEENCRHIKRAYNAQPAECPYNNTCHKSIRCISPDGTTHTCPAVADDIMKGTHDFFLGRAEKLPFEYTLLTPDCPTCPNMNLCNSCTKRIIDIREHTGVDEHCKNMRRLSQKIKNSFKEI